MVEETMRAPILLEGKNAGFQFKERKGGRK
jgi:hypothetical protein